MFCEHLSNSALESNLMLACFQANRMTAQILVYLADVEERGIYLAKAYPSMFAYCKRQLGMSGGQAYRRIAGARLIRRYPFLLERIESGEIFLTTLAQIISFITDENVHELVDATVGKTRAEIDVLLCERFGVERVHGPAHCGPGIPMDAELAAMVQRARELYSHAVPNGDPTELAKRAFALLIDRGEREKRGKANKPRPSPAKATKSGKGKTSRGVTREVFETKGEQCCFVDEETGLRCTSRVYIQLDHIKERGRGGSDEAWNRRPLCGPHNRWLAEQTYGREYIEYRIRLRQQKQETPPPDDVPRE